MNFRVKLKSINKPKYIRLKFNLEQLKDPNICKPSSKPQLEDIFAKTSAVTTLNMTIPIIQTIMSVREAETATKKMMRIQREGICCYGFEDDAYDNTDKHAGPGGPLIPGMDSSHERPPLPGMDSSHERPPIPDTDANDESPPIPDNVGGGDNNEKDNANPERHKVGKMLIVVIPVVGVLILLVLVTCGICILKKCNHDKIKTQNYQDMGITEKHQIAITSTAIYPDNPPPYTPTMEYGEIKSAPMEFLEFGTGWYAPEIRNVPPSNTKLVDQALQMGPQY